ncbi:hypothetical protein PR048_012883 [Dryococelus australis]|uniref:Uncharacterized protein n=1 Tax=Dryococelus australis TaxID=614101 RepID=A0ABQ9HRG4_9NEOP|nr:hypothetical protein PR048_012883 [Dryococelus australis]
MGELKKQKPEQDSYFIGLECQQTLYNMYPGVGIPKIPYLKVSAAILEEAGNAFIVLIDYYSHWLPLTAQPSASVINAMQDVFKMH